MRPGDARANAFDALRGMGLFVRTDFLDADACAAMEARFVGAEANPAQVTSADGDGEYYVDRSVRSTDRIRLPEPFDGQVRARLNDLLGPLAEHFGVTLADCENPQYLVYGPGDFFKAHRDNNANNRRKVSIVIYLSGVAGEQPAPFSGGELVLYGLLPVPGWERRGVHVPPQQGALVAFPSDTRHEVLPVTGGKRCTIVTWAR